LEFNPWLFSGSDQLLEAFFLDVGAQFRDRGARLADLAADIEAYAEVVAPLKWLPIVGMWVERARSVTKAVKKAAERRRGGVLAQRERLARKLQALDRP
jgi:predicted KAP-like P-loop ATPase